LSKSSVYSGKTLRKLKYGVIGVGIIGKHHVKCATEIPEINLVAVSDVNERALKEVKDQYGVKIYKDYHEMIEKENLEAVSICVPHFLHAPITLDVIKMGVHVLVEKPIALSVKEADEMINAAKKHGVKLGVVFQNRTNPLLLYIKDMITKGEVGDMLRAHLTYLCYRSQSYYQSASWRGKWKSEGGGVLINQAIHFIDIFQWLVGIRPLRLYSFASRLAHNIEVEDIAVAILEFENRALGSIQVSSIEVPQQTRIEIRGDKKAVIIEKNTAYIFSNDVPLKESILKLPMWKTPTYIEKKITLDDFHKEWGHKVVLQDFAKAVLNDRDPMVTGEEAEKSLEIVNAIILSSVKRKEVQFPISRDEYEEVLKHLSETKGVDLVRK